MSNQRIEYYSTAFCTGQIADYLKKYRNTARFLLGNMNTFDYEMLLDYNQLKPVCTLCKDANQNSIHNLIFLILLGFDLQVDKYMLHELYHFGKTVTNAYNDFAFIKGIY